MTIVEWIKRPRQNGSVADCARVIGRLGIFDDGVLSDEELTECVVLDGVVLVELLLIVEREVDMRSDINVSGEDAHHDLADDSLLAKSVA